MKKSSFLLLLISFCTSAWSQRNLQLKGDSIQAGTSAAPAELVLQNNTKNISGFLYNKGNGRTEFRRAMVKVNDSVYVFGGDTLRLNAAANSSNLALTNGYIAVGTGSGVAGSSNLQFDGSKLFSSKRLEVSMQKVGQFNLVNSAYVTDMAANDYAEFIFGKSESVRNRFSMYYLHKTDGGTDNEVGFAFHSGPSLIRMISDNQGKIYMNSLKTGSTAPVQTGTTKMVTTDQDGLLSFATIPSGGAFTINNNVDNRLLTANGTTGSIEAESGVTYNGSLFSVSGQLTASRNRVGTATLVNSAYVPDR